MLIYVLFFKIWNKIIDIISCRPTRLGLCKINRPNKPNYSLHLINTFFLFNSGCLTLFLNIWTQTMCLKFSETRLILYLDICSLRWSAVVYILLKMAAVVDRKTIIKWPVNFLEFFLEFCDPRITRGSTFRGTKYT